MTQRDALDILKTGVNVFLTGEPGSGKTYTINQYVSYLDAYGISPAITASTGIAATHIGGRTIHSWSGIGVKQTLTKKDIDRIRKKRAVAKQITETHVLIIDEVSMLSAQTLSMVDMVCRDIKRDKRPFGGLQVILVGDFFQLPPIAKKEPETQQSLMGNNQAQLFAYDSASWQELDLTVCYLSEQHRQEDETFLQFLSAVRTQQVEEHHKDLLRARYAPRATETMTQLYAHNADVDTMNDRALNKLPGEVETFTMTGSGSSTLTDTLKRGCLSPEILKLKINARVMFTRNDVQRQRYVNGTLGTVVQFSRDNYPIVKTESGKLITAEPVEWHIEDGERILASIAQIPLRLAWALTVHKSQGVSLDAAHMDLSQTFAYGQGYVALSRVRTLAGLSLAGLNQRALEVHPSVRTKDVVFRRLSKQAQQNLRDMSSEQKEKFRANFIRSCGGHAPKPLSKTNVKKKTRNKESTFEKTLALLKQKKTLFEISEMRGLTVDTIMSHIEKLIETKKINPLRELAHLQKPKGFTEIKKAFAKVKKAEGRMLLAKTRAALGNVHDFKTLRLARLFLL